MPPVIEKPIALEVGRDARPRELEQSVVFRGHRGQGPRDEQRWLVDGATQLHGSTEYWCRRDYGRDFGRALWNAREMLPHRALDNRDVDRTADCDGGNPATVGADD